MKYRTEKEGEYLRIYAIIDIPLFGVKAGDKGGRLAREGNLAQEGDAWVSGNARVFGDAQVFGDARVYGNARLACPSDIRCISGFTFPITRTKGYAVIGCKRKAIKEWLALSKEQAIAMGIKAEEYAPIRAVLRATRIKGKNK